MLFPRSKTANSCSNFKYIQHSLQCLSVYNFYNPLDLYVYVKTIYIEFVIPCCCLFNSSQLLQTEEIPFLEKLSNGRPTRRLRLNQGSRKMFCISCLFTWVDFPFKIFLYMYLIVQFLVSYYKAILQRGNSYLNASSNESVVDVVCSNLQALTFIWLCISSLKRGSSYSVGYSFHSTKLINVIKRRNNSQLIA